jgi:broad specificity phosphatase PhoE
MLAPEGADAIRASIPDITARITGDVIVEASDLCRAKDSAAIIAAELGVGVRTDPRLRELSFGEWEGRTWNELEAADGERLQTWMSAWMTAPPGGESVEMLASRVSDWLRTYEHRSGTVVAVAHAGSIRAALSCLRHRPLDQMFDIVIGYAGVIAVQSSAKGSAEPIL